MWRVIRLGHMRLMEVLTLLFRAAISSLEVDHQLCCLKHKIIGEVVFKPVEMKQQLVAYSVFGQVII